MINKIAIYCRKKDGSEESDFKDAVTVCLPIVNTTIRDIEKGVFPKGFSLDIEVPTSPLANKVCFYFLIQCSGHLLLNAYHMVISVYILVN